MPQTAAPFALRPWGRLASTVVLGPVAAAWWASSPRRRARWIAISAVSLVGVVTLFGGGWPLLPATVESPRGILKWLVVAPLLGFALASVWARALGLVMSRRATRPPDGDGRIRHPGVVGAAGLVVPGLGLVLAQRSRPSGWLFGLTAPLAAAGLVLLHATWLWERRATSVTPGLSAPALETVFLAAAGIVATVGLVWLVQALEGVRRAAPSPSPRVSGLVSVGLLVAIAAFGIGFRPADVAARLGSTAGSFQRDGWRVVPLVLTEAAVRLDPATPDYLARAAGLHAALGRGEAAHACRDRLAERARDWSAAARQAGRPPRPSSSVAPATPAGQAAPAVQAVRAEVGSTWSRMDALFR
jgi:hypothetical protein